MTFTTSPRWMRLVVAGLAALVFAIASPQANAALALVTVPNSADGVDGSTRNSIPFGTNSFCANGIRYQQLLPGAMIGGGFVAGLSFRLDEDTLSNPGTMNFQGVTVRLSSTYHTSGTLFENMDDNLGADVTTVYSGDLSVVPTITGVTPNPFDFTIPISDDFAFSGNQFNLLIDVIIEGCYDDTGGTVFLDAVVEPGLGRVTSNDITDPIGVVSGTALVTQITLTTPPPLPYSRGLGTNWTIVGHDGEGFMIDVLPDGRMVVFWFTYDSMGNQMWLIGVAENFVGDEATLELFRTEGPEFGPGYDPADRVSTSWGTIVLEFFDCNSGQVTYISTLGFGAGNYQIQRVYTTEQSSCPF